MRPTALIVASLVVLSSAAIAATAGPSNSVVADRSGIVPTASGLPAAIASTTDPMAIDPATPGATAPGSPADLASPPQNTTAYLVIPSGQVLDETTERSDLDVAGAVGVDGAPIGGQLATIGLEDRLAAADTTTAKRAIIADTATGIDGRIDRLERDQAAAIEAYNDESISAREFVYRLATIATRAAAVRTQVDRLDSAATSVPGTSIDGQPVDGWARDRNVELSVFTSPVRDAIVRAFDGEGAISVYIETTEDGVVLATIDRSRYVREAYLPGERDDGSTDGPNSISEALDRVAEVYPWAWANSTGVESGGGSRAGAYQFTLFHQQGRLTTHLDPDTGAVFREVQSKVLGTVPMGPTVSATNDGLRLHVASTHPTGPMNVSVTDAETGEPVNTTVAVDGRTVGRTASDGQLWAIALRGEFNVTATDDDDTVAVSVSSRTDPIVPGAVAASGTENRTNGSGTRDTPTGNRSVPPDVTAGNRSTNSTGVETPG